MNVSLKAIGILAFLFCSAKAQAQTIQSARELFEIGNFEGALDEYLEIYNQNKDEIEVNYNLAICYLNTNIDKSKAIPYLEKLNDTPKITPNVKYLLGRAYHFGYRFDDAIDKYNEFIEGGKGDEFNLLDAPVQIKYCENAKELMKFPVSVKFQNLGKKVNSKYADYFPFIPEDESYVLFNSNRNASNALTYENGSNAPSVYHAVVKDGKFESAKQINVPTEKEYDRMEIVGLNNKGLQAIFYASQSPLKGNLYTGTIFDNSVESTVLLPSTINSKDVEIAGCMSSDNQKFYFASNRDGGYGGTDLYLCQRLPNGEWSEAQNLGPNINTPMDEDFPNLSPDGKTLFFSSKGHAGMGGYDIFKASWNADKKKYGAVQNMGYPLNTPEDNMNFRISKTGKYGYISALRKGGFGDLDIYRVDFMEVDSRYTVITGQLTPQDGKEFEDVFIQITDAVTDEIYGDYIPNYKTNRYVIILPPGNYNMFVGALGYEEQYYQLDIQDKSSFRSAIKKDMTMIPVPEDE